MSKRKTSLGCLFWIALILLVLVIFLFNRTRIRTVLEETGFSNYISRQTEDEPEIVRVSPDKKNAETKEDQHISVPTEEGEDETSDTPENDGKPELTVEPVIPEESGDTEQEPLVQKKMRRSVLYFVVVGDSGDISLKRIIRPVYYKDSPLTETLNTLLQGLSSRELNEGLLNLIPQNTELKRVWVEEGVAYLDFSEELRFNQFGTEGLKAELQQIVYTATEFETVHAVQILIEGEKIDYLSSEGVYIGKPLSRNELSEANH